LQEFVGCSTAFTSQVVAQAGFGRIVRGMTMTAQSRPANETAAFLERFQVFWSDPHRVPLSTLLTPDVALVQPLTGWKFGLPAAEAWRGRLLSAMPSLRAEVEGWSATQDLLFIAIRLRAREPGYALEWPAVDRFRLRAGYAAERITYFDSLELLRQVARQPRTWLRFMRWAGSEWMS
jgi:hypothetical protein